MKKLFIATLLAVGSVHAAQAPHDAAPMMFDAQADKDAKQAAVAAKVATFQKAYVKAGKPKMAIYYNRTLSDQVEEWYTPVEVDTAIMNRKGELMQAQTAVRFRNGNNTQRAGQGESFDWAFEEGFYEALLNAQARLVDRTMMQRLTAEKHDPKNKTQAVKHIEVQAFKGYADILVELEIQRNSSLPGGYNFKAKATSVKSAQVMAMVNASDIEPTKYKYMATSNGYEKAPANADPEQVKDIGRQVAERLMASLARSL